MSVDVEVHFTAHINEKYFKGLVNRAKEAGHGYEDPGEIQIVQRLLVSDGISVLEELQDPAEGYTLTNHVKRS